jgi:hypothetical protein
LVAAFPYYDCSKKEIDIEKHSPTPLQKNILRGVLPDTSQNHLLQPIELYNKNPYYVFPLNC